MLCLTYQNQKAVTLKTLSPNLTYILYTNIYFLISMTFKKCLVWLAVALEYIEQGIQNIKPLQTDQQTDRRTVDHLPAINENEKLSLGNHYKMNI